ncbi:mid1-interacting protein 1-like protein [Dermatophagoides farinae]|uniref:Mid1-interacting protein 1-like protein n=1 Tax=Dermatophagoides farinae TaxID=6954 RepID=A0A9D4NZM3_DERFA|nr:mid1-interacting protein 1-like protein [Dermatophagoides farinae]
MCSQQSILIAMERFVRSMNNLDQTILIPSKLRDMDNIGIKTERHLIPEIFYNINQSNQSNQQQTTNELHNFFIIDADSMLTDSCDDTTSNLFVSFRHHLQGLHTILNQLSDSADYLSIRYQEEIDDI